MADCRSQLGDHRPQVRQTRVTYTENHDTDIKGGDILLILKILVAGHEDVVFMRRDPQQFAVLNG